MKKLPTTRTLKIYYGYHGKPYVKHPMIRLAGKYLSAMDFRIGDEIEVIFDASRIVITKRNLIHVAPGETESGSAEAQPARDSLV